MMRDCYKYWERRIFNALTKLILRALAGIKTLFTRSQRPFLLHITSDYSHPQINLYPSKDELISQLDKLSRNVLQVGRSFGRWWKDFCKVFEEKIDPETSDKRIPFTFDADLVQNPIITTLNYDLCQARNQVIEKIAYVCKGWKSKIDQAKIFDKNNMNRLARELQRNTSTSLIENRIIQRESQRTFIQSLPSEGRNFFILIDNSQVKARILDKLQEWLSMLGDGLNDLAS